MKYIFDLWWFNHGGRERFNLTPADYQDPPVGGWDNWTPAHNVDWIRRNALQGEDFMLIGDRVALRGQANNAGSGNTRCMVGAEVLLLLSAGYTLGIPDENARAQGYVCRLIAPREPKALDAQLVSDAEQYLVSTAEAAHFWQAGRKRAYQGILGIL